MKKKLLCLLIFFLIPISVQAKNVKVMALVGFSTTNPTKTFTLQTIENEKFPSGYILPAGAIITGNVNKIEEPKRCKRNAYFELVPDQITYNNKPLNINLSPYRARVIDYKPAIIIAYNITKKSIGYIFLGTTQCISFIEGVSKDEDGNRIKSGLTQVYEDLPISYIEEGKPLNIERGDVLILKLIKTR